MSAILKALGPIFNIFILLVFFIVVFAIVGVEFYAGGYHSHCVRKALKSFYNYPIKLFFNPKSADGEIYGENQLCVGNVNTTNGISWSARAPYTCPPEVRVI